MPSTKRTGKYDQARDEVEFRFSFLPDGGTEAGQICPACKGGSSQEGSLSITRRGGLLLYNCHRSSCTFYGAITLAGRAGLGGTQQGSQRKARENLVTTYEINTATLKFLAAKYSVTIENLRSAGLRWSGDGDGYLGRRVCFPIYGPDSKQRGASYRSYEDGVSSKAIIQLFDDDAVCQSWYKWKLNSKTLVIVEDPMSAIKLAPHVHSLSLMGVNLSDMKLDEILAQKYEKVIISLDADATREAIKLQLKYRNRFKDNLFVHGLAKDIKDMNEEELNEYLSDL